MCLQGKWAILYTLYIHAMIFIIRAVFHFEYCASSEDYASCFFHRNRAMTIRLANEICHIVRASNQMWIDFMYVIITPLHFAMITSNHNRQFVTQRLRSKRNRNYKNESHFKSIQNNMLLFVARYSRVQHRETF